MARILNPFIFSGVAGNVDLSAIIAYYAMDESSGNEVDSHASYDPIETGGAIASATGILGTCRDLERADGRYFEVAHSAGISSVQGITCWVNLESKPGGGLTIAGKFLSTGSQREWQLYWSSPRFRYRVSATGSSTITTVSSDFFGDPDTATWYFVAAWHDEDEETINLQVNDGATIDSVAHSGGIFSGTGPFVIGADNAAASVFDGLIDEMALWNRPPTPAEITYLYGSGTPPAYPF